MKTNLPDFLNNKEMQELAKNVKFFRELDHMSIEELAEEMERSISYIQAIENATRMSTYRDVQALSDCLEVSPPDLLGLDYEESGPEDETSDMVEYYLDRAIKLMDSNCNTSECEFIIDLIPILGTTYRKGSLLYYNVKYEANKPKYSKDTNRDHLIEHFYDYNNRECAVIANCIEQIIPQIQSGATTIDVYFPERAVDLNNARYLYDLVN